MSTQPGMAAHMQQFLRLEYPMSLATYDSYAEAQHTVDFLADKEFPVQDVMIVGTDLKQVERVRGRLTTGKVVVGGLLAVLGFCAGFLLAVVIVTALGYDTRNAAIATGVAASRLQIGSAFEPSAYGRTIAAVHASITPSRMNGSSAPRSASTGMCSR